MSTKSALEIDLSDTQHLVAGAVQRLRAAFAAGHTRPVAWRLAQLEAIERLLIEGEPRIAAALEQDLGRSAADTFLGDIAPTAAEARHARKNLRTWMKPHKVRLPISQLPGRGWYEHEPLGVTAIISPWNYPAYLAFGPLIAAVAAGNCAVIKPSEHAPEAARVIAELAEEYLDPEAFVVLQGGPAVTQEIVDQGLDLVFFTGAPEIGKAVMETAARHLTPVILELGGKCPVYVAADADLDVAARRIAWTKLMNSGQTCIAPDYVLVEGSVLPQFESALCKAVLDLSPEHGGGKALPIVNSRHAARLAQLLENHGGTVIHGGESDAAGSRVDLTIVRAPRADSRLMTEEIFGPLMPLVPVDSFLDAVSKIAQGPKPLAAYIFTKSAQLRANFRAQVSAGAIVGNHVAMHVLVPELPFGGVGNSGMGAYHGKWGFEAFSNRKANLDRPTNPDLRIVYPPYGRVATFLLRKLF